MAETKQEKRTFKDVKHSEVKEMLKDVTFKILKII